MFICNRNDDSIKHTNCVWQAWKLETRKKSGIVKKVMQQQELQYGDNIHALLFAAHEESLLSPNKVEQVKGYYGTRGPFDNCMHLPFILK